MQRGPVQSQMQCQDARRAFPYMVAGEIPLTEWALLERHVSGCDECRMELDRLRDLAAVRIRAQRRQRRRRLLVAVGVLVVAGAGLYAHRLGLPEIPHPEFSSSSTAAPPDSSDLPTFVAKPQPRPLTPTPPIDSRSAPTSAPVTPELPPLVPRSRVASEPPPPASQPAVSKSVPPTVTAPPSAPASKPDAPKPELVSQPAPTAPSLPPVSTPPPVLRPGPAPATAAVPVPGSASTATASDERMPTQGWTGGVIHAAPTAESMPTQGPGQGPPRGRQ